MEFEELNYDQDEDMELDLNNGECEDLDGKNVLEKQEDNTPDISNEEEKPESTTDVKDDVEIDENGEKEEKKDSLPMKNADEDNKDMNTSNDGRNISKESNKAKENDDIENKQKKLTDKILRVSNLTRNVQIDNLKYIFKKFGEIDDIAFDIDRRINVKKNIADVLFKAPEMAEAARIHMDGGQIDGEVIKCLTVSKSLKELEKERMGQMKGNQPPRSLASLPIQKTREQIPEKNKFRVIDRESLRQEDGRGTYGRPQGRNGPDYYRRENQSYGNRRENHSRDNYRNYNYGYSNHDSGGNYREQRGDRRDDNYYGRGGGNSYGQGKYGGRDSYRRDYSGDRGRRNDSGYEVRYTRRDSRDYSPDSEGSYSSRSGRGRGRGHSRDDSYSSYSSRRSRGSSYDSRSSRSYSSRSSRSYTSGR